MRYLPIILLSCALLMACSDDDGETIEDVCNARCEKDKAKCITYYNTCLSWCKTKATDANMKYIAGCGMCVAKSFGYYFDPSTGQCLGPQFKTATDKSCIPSCFLPDGGAGY